MDIIFCNIGDHPFYNGEIDIPTKGGGEWNKEHIPGEINNFTNFNGTYYGFVEPPGEEKVIAVDDHFSDICGDNRKNTYAKGVLVVWVASGKIVGWYKDANVYRHWQNLPDSTGRVYDTYNISSKEAVRIPFGQREELISIRWRSIYYAEDPTGEMIIQKVKAYIEKYEKYLNFFTQKSEEELNSLDESRLIGEDAEYLGKYRRNQEAFRRQLIKNNDGKCSMCPCGINMTEVLIASHIKPWADSDCNEKLSSCNGLLLCPNHDKLFDNFLISFEDDGKILISEKLKKNSPHLFNISENTTIKVKDEMKPFLAYHRAKFFELNK